MTEAAALLLISSVLVLVLIALGVVTFLSAIDSDSYAGVLLSLFTFALMSILAVVAIKSLWGLS